MTSFNEVCIDVTKTAKKIPQSDYLVSGKYKIFDQGKDYIGGYTNDKTGIVEDYPYIVFGDHTRIIKFVDEPCFIGADGVKLLKVYNSQFLPKYVYYSLVANPIVSLGYSRHFKYLKEQSIRDCSINEQERIITELETNEKAISIKKESLYSLDELVKSRFIEMFGNPISEQKWIIKKWNDVLEIKNGKDYKKNLSDIENGYPVYGSGGFMNIYADTYLCEGIITIIGRKGNISNPLLVEGKIWNVDTAFGIIVKTDILNPIFFHHCSKFYDYEKMNKATTIPSLTKSDLLNLEIILPPIELQNKFAEFVKLIDKSKFVCHSKNFLCDILTFSSSTMAYPSVVSIFV